ncbi:MAG: RBBP9/YdeN family alpha/beta hydrolase, partial [Candidatus Nanoarchaeia archaeon]
KKLYLVHGWIGTGSRKWFDWLKSELEKTGEWGVVMFDMPDSKNPDADIWADFLNKNISELNEDVFVLGHSAGARAVVRYIENFPEGIKIGGVILVGGSFKPIENINFNKLKKHCDNYFCIYSTDDYYIDVKDADIFREKLGRHAKILIMENKGHFINKDGVVEFPEILNFLLEGK